jgi:hypothetical protein
MHEDRILAEILETGRMEVVERAAAWPDLRRAATQKRNFRIN